MLGLTKMSNDGQEEIFCVIFKSISQSRCVQLHELGLAYHYGTVNVEMVAWFNETSCVQLEAFLRKKKKQVASLFYLITYFLVVKIFLEHRSLGFLQTWGGYRACSCTGEQGISSLTVSLSLHGLFTLAPLWRASMGLSSLISIPQKDSFVFEEMPIVDNKSSLRVLANRLEGEQLWGSRIVHNKNLKFYQFNIQYCTFGNWTLESDILLTPTD